jgi:hypothetical protein
MFDIKNIADLKNKKKFNICADLFGQFEREREDVETAAGDMSPTLKGDDKSKFGLLC